MAVSTWSKGRSKGLSDRRRLALLVAIMTVVAMSAAALSVGILYWTAFNEQSARLADAARSQARLIKALTASDAGGTASAATVQAAEKRVAEAHRRTGGLGRTGEFLLARRIVGSIVFVPTRRDARFGLERRVPWDGESASPMRRALEGESGTLVAIDYRGERVLAAFQPVPGLDLGIVAKIDIAEIRAPFLRAGAASAACALIVLLLGALLFRRISAPIVHRGRIEAALRQSEGRFRGTFEMGSVGMSILGSDGR